MKPSALLYMLPLLLAGLSLTACEDYSGRTATTRDVVIHATDTRIETVTPEPAQALDLTITPEMLAQVVIETDEVVSENQAQLQLPGVKEKDVRYKGRLFLQPNENALLPSFEGAMLEIEVKTQSP
ncbi:MAG TPA: hypothetical protein VIQ03_14990 [Gammaproteobacteria bacterium]